MVTFIVRRLIASVFVLLGATFLMYIMVANSGDPLAEFRASSSPNKLELMAARSAKLHLDVAPPLRYFIWLRGAAGCLIGKCDLGTTLQNQPVTTLLAGAMGQTIKLITVSILLAIMFGIAIGITTALRQYSGYDYVATFFAFLFFSLPVFWVAVLLKQYIAIGFNDFLRDPQVSVTTTVVLSLIMAVVFAGIVGGSWKTRGITAAAAFVMTALALWYISATEWLLDPGLGPVVIAVTGAAFAFAVTALTAGLRNRRALFASLTTVVIGVICYFVLQSWLDTVGIWGLLLGAIVAIGVGIGVGYAWGGDDKAQSARAAAITAFLVGGLIVADRLMQSWKPFMNSRAVGKRPFATTGSQTPGLKGDFWMHTTDTLVHLLLPTIALMLITLAAHSRYVRASMLDVLSQDYIRTARAKGLSERTVVMRHAFRNALIPLATIIAFDFGGLIGGAVITETVFGWKAMGSVFQDGLRTIDLNPVMGFLVVTGALAIIFNLIADLLYAVLDPRIRVS